MGMTAVNVDESMEYQPNFLFKESRCRGKPAGLFNLRAICGNILLKRWDKLFKY